VNAVKGWVATRTTAGVWHWAIALATNGMTPACGGASLAWNRSIRPSEDYRIERDRSDTLCLDCNAIHRWDGLVTGRLS
jgi:hypothetical protein